MSIRIDLDRSKLTWRYHWRLRICMWLLDKIEAHQARWDNK